MNLAEKCFSVRKAKKWSQKYMAEQIGTTQTELSFIEHGFMPKDYEKAMKIECLYDEIVKGELA